MSRILTSLHGRKLGLDSDGRLIAPVGVRIGEHGSQFSLTSPNRCALFDDFLGDVVADEWNYVETDADGAGAVVAGGRNGIFRLTTGNDDANNVHLVDYVALLSYLNWQVQNGKPLEFQARVKISRITLAYLFVGFTDNAAIEVPINGTNGADTIVTTATDATGFLFDTGMTTAGLRLVGVANDTDASIQNLGSSYSPVADTYVDYRIELEYVSASAAKASFFINGLQVGTVMTGALTPGVGLTPVVGVSNLDGTSALTCDIDYIYVSQKR